MLVETVAAAIGLALGLAVGLIVAAHHRRAAAAQPGVAAERLAAAVAAAIASERDRLDAEQRSALAASEQSHREAVDRLRAEIAAGTARVDATAARERDQMARERTVLEGERAALDGQRGAVARERTALAEDAALLERREGKLTARETALAEHGTALDRRLAGLDRREGALAERETGLAARDHAASARETAVAGGEALLRAELERVAGLDRAAARAELFARLDAELAEEQTQRIARHEKDLAARSRELAIEVVGRAIQRYAAEHTADTTSTKVAIADEELKGRIIGKEGRNIRAFEQATGVDLIIDDTPGQIIISCFSGLRREIARRTLERLLLDGRIQPARIEEVLTQVQQDLDREVIRLGEEAAYACDVSGLHPQLIKLLGKLQFRTSYGQNVLKHTQEVAFLCGAMAGDLGLDAKLGRRCGLLHDIGKALDHEQEGSHPELGHAALKRYGESEIVANAALAHHEGREVFSTYTTLAAAADAISAARPGARSENVENYLKRLGQLEDIACSFTGVQKAYAIQAGRELRVLVNAHTLGDGELLKVARDIARRIADEVAFPGEVKVTVIRELRQIAVAR